MTIEQVQKRLTVGLSGVLISVLLVVLLRIHSGVDLLDLNNASVLTLQIIVALSLLQVNHTFSIIRNRSVLPAITYLMIVGTDSRFFTDLTSCIVTICFLLIFICCFLSYQRKDAQAQLFNITLLIAGGSILWAPMILFIPLFWLIFARFQALNLRSFTASLLAVCIVASFVFAYCVYREDWTIATGLLPEAGEFLPLRIRLWDTIEIVRLSFTSLLILLSFVHFQQKSYTEKIRIRAFLYFLYFFILVSGFCLAFTGSDKNELLSILSLASSIVIAHYLTLSQNKFTAYVLLSCIFFYIISYFWMHYEYLFTQIKWIDSISIF